MKITFVFFGTPQPAVELLDELGKAGLTPGLIVTNPDRPRGRGLLLAPPPVKLWAVAHHIPLLQPERQNDPDFIRKLQAANCELFLVVAYGAILPKNILALPPRGVLNVHYSLLPKYRGATPVESQILADDRETGVTLMLMDERLDRGPMVAQKKVAAANWPPTAEELRKTMNRGAARLLVETLPLWVAGKITPIPQDDAKATYTRKMTAEDRLVDLSRDGYKNFLKIQAFAAWGTYFFAQRRGRNVRVKIALANCAHGDLRLLRVVPEGKKEMDYDDFLKGL